MMTHDEAAIYHSNPALSQSRLKEILKCPALYKYNVEHAEEQSEEETKTLLLGSLFHAMVLEPETIDKLYKIKQFKGTTKEGKAERLAAIEAGITLVSEDLWQQAAGMANSVTSSKRWQLIQKAETCDKELSVYWEQHDIAFKARLDCVAYIRDYGHVILDLKSTQDASPEAITKSIFKYGYHMQAAWYKYAYERESNQRVTDFIFMFVEKKPPYIMTMASVDEAVIAKGLDQIHNAVELYKTCIANNNWPSYAEGIINIELPKWA